MYIFNIFYLQIIINDLILFYFIKWYGYEL
jgi:hypothetical protein